MIRQSIAKRYAKGLFAVGEKDGQYKGYLAELENILGLFEKEQRLKKALMLPLLEIQKKKSSERYYEDFGTSLPLANMLTMLLEKIG